MLHSVPVNEASQFALYCQDFAFRNNFVFFNQQDGDSDDGDDGSGGGDGGMEEEAARGEISEFEQ